MGNALNVTTPISMGGGHITADGAPSTPTGVRVWDTNQVDIYIDVTAISGTLPTLRANFETADVVKLEDVAAGDWFYIQSFPIINQIGRYKITITEGLCRYLRVNFDVGGTSPDFTLAVTMNSHLKF